MSGRLFVGNLSPQITEKQLARFFSSAGLVASVRIPLDRQTGRSRGFGFVEFASRDQAEHALAVFDGRELGGRVLRVGWAREPEKRGFQERGSAGKSFGEKNRAAELAQTAHAQEAWDPLEAGETQDYSSHRDSRSRKRGKHGSDRRRGRGTRRFIE